MTLSAKKLQIFTWAFVFFSLCVSLLGSLGTRADHTPFLTAASSADTADAKAMLTGSTAFQAALTVAAAYGNQELLAQLRPAVKAFGG